MNLTYPVDQKQFPEQSSLLYVRSAIDLGDKSPALYRYAYFYSGVCCSLALHVISEAFLSVSSWIVLKESLGALIPWEVLRCGEFWLCHHCQATWGSANKLSIHLHTFMGLIAAGVDSVVSVSETATGEGSRGQHCNNWCVHNCRR